MVRFDDTQVVRAVDAHGARDDLADIDGAALHEIAVRGHSLDAYLGREEVFPAPLDPPYRTATVLFATGCPHGCYFCQSSLEYAADGGRVVQRDERALAEEIRYLHIEHDAGAVFALAPNLSLGHLRAVYRVLDELGVSQIPISGFVRAADIVAADRDGTLDALVSSGMRVLSVGLDLPYATRDDRFGKHFDFATMEGALRACSRCGVAVAATVVAPPDMSASELAGTLSPLFALPLCSVDVRIATAFRHTPYFESVEPHLRRHPDRDVGYFERQSYRYQTIRLPGRVRPRQTYRIVRRFTTRFERHPDHRRAVAALLDEHPALGPVFGLPGGGQDGAAAAYDPVADLYDKVFADIRVRRAEWRWVAAQVPLGAGLDVLDVGCGAGGLLRALAPRIASGTGVDVSQGMLDRACARSVGDPKLRFESLMTGRLPFVNDSFDLAISFLSLHYLNWPEAIDEILRVLRPGGRFLCVDMVASPVAILELPQYVAAQASVVGQHARHRRFAADLRELVRQPAWQAVERRYPLRPLSDYERLARDLDTRLEILTVGKAAKVVALAAQPGAKVETRSSRSCSGTSET
jgi:SAM-dependent methyltransferase